MVDIDVSGRRNGLRRQYDRRGLGVDLQYDSVSGRWYLPQGAYPPPATPPLSNGLGVTGFVLTIIAAIVGPLIWLFADPAVYGAPGVLGFLLAALALALGGPGLYRARKGLAGHINLAMIGVVGGAATIGILILQLTIAISVFYSDADDLCSRLSNQYEVESAIDAISTASPGRSAGAQIERAKMMVNSECPGSIGLVGRAEDLLYRPY
ncbi:hypothetical protein [Pseudonocardia endophytica]|uniref:hypothetical protein n=1 Tax=Pseudonocardia endophytica TaxID=401976 RepID=UPI001053D82B|nr:hypothetical protein [Pseudonocardia endophytica]